MKVLVACEFSGAIRDAFRRLEHDAWSCDLDGIEPEGQWTGYHLTGDCRQYIDSTWNLLIAHPPCTFLANSGVRWLYGGSGNTHDPIRWQNMQEAASFFKQLLDAPVDRIAVENPIMHRHGLELVGRPCNQIIQPWQFGHGESKATCLWLKGLPPLQPTSIVEGRKPRVHFTSPGPERWKERSRTLPGIAAAMAAQWSRHDYDGQDDLAQSYKACLAAVRERKTAGGKGWEPG